MNAPDVGRNRVDQFSIVNVVQEKVCVGCGACAVATASRLAVHRNRYGYFQLQLDHADAADLQTATKVCPFADEAVDENVLAKEFLPHVGRRDSRVGQYLSVYAGRVAQGEDLTRSSSGGMTSWLALKLLQHGHVDGVIHVTAGDSPELFRYCVSSDAEQLRAGRKSQYYSTSMAEALGKIRGDGKTYAFIGVPCFIKALRLLCREDAVLRSQIGYCIGLVCGHLKSSGFAESMAWQLGIEPAELAGVDFRVKVPGKPANHYDFGAWRSGDSQKLTRPTRSLVGGNWGHAMFQLKACDYCDDVFAETADIAFGDAWLPQYTSDWRGTNIVVNRHPLLQGLLEEGLKSGELVLESISVAQAAASQEANYRHRWDGLSVRLQDDREQAKWSPKKRIHPGSRRVSETRRRIVRLRRELAALSHEAFAEAKEAQELEHFIKKLSPLVEAMTQLYQKPEGHPLYLLLRRTAGALLRRMGLRNPPAITQR